jgi:hypothetical protein
MDATPQPGCSATPQALLIRAGEGEVLPGKCGNFRRGKGPAGESIHGREDGKNVALNVKVAVDERFPQGKLERRRQHTP